MNNILVLGATGTFGSALVKELIHYTNLSVTVFSRHVDDMYKNDNRIEVMKGDATDIQQLKEVIRNKDVVFCAISGNQLPIVARNLVFIMSENKKKRLIFMGAVGIYNEIPDYIAGDDNVSNEPSQIPNQEAVKIIENSQLEYTILRPGYLRLGNENDYVLTYKGEKAKGYVTTIASLTRIILDMLNHQNKYLHESISITKDMTNMTKEQMKEAEL